MIRRHAPLVLLLAAGLAKLGDSMVQCRNDEGNEVFTELVSGVLRGNTLGRGGEAEQQVVSLLLGCLSADELAQMNG